ncbi:MAG TPA: hypothetical protein VHS31_00535 [Tepidisphaeraceae bacterium]|jgi:hypothetical protein|nr:hypothetical protein [Tepidisphaeraceae bacterium]
MKFSRFWIIALAFCFVAKGLAADIDQSNPKAAAMSFAKALEAGDAKTARQLATGSDADKQVIDAMISFNSAVKKLRESAVKKYTDKSDEVVSPGSTIDSTKVLEDTEVKEEGDVAAIVPTKPQQRQSAMHMKRVDGKWNVNLNQTLQDAAAPGQTIEQMHAMLESWGDIFKETADEIDQGKYPTPADANQALGVKMMATLKSFVPSTAPATPTSEPSN